MSVLARTAEPEAAADRAAPLELFFDELRVHFARHDLDDATLSEALSDAAGHLSAEECGLVLDRLAEGRADLATRRRLASLMCLPAPRAPLAMPTQTLERGRLALLPKLNVLRALARRRIGQG